MSESEMKDERDAVAPASTDTDEPSDKESTGTGYPAPDVVGTHFPEGLREAHEWFVTNAGDKKAYAPWEYGPKRYVSWKNDPDAPTKFDEAMEYVDGEYGMFDFLATRNLPSADTGGKHLVFFDFDDCRDPDTEEVHPQAWEILNGVPTGDDVIHATVSSSGTGIHGYGYATDSLDGYKDNVVLSMDDWEHTENPELELYANDRFIVTTGQHLEGTSERLLDLTEFLKKTQREEGKAETDAEAAEPSLSESEIADVDTTDDFEVIISAIDHVDPESISIRSEVTGERPDGTKDVDPSWEVSDSGERIGWDEDGFIYRKGGHHLDVLQLVALEERIISDPREYPSGDDFIEAVDELRSRGADIPEYEPPTELERDAYENAALHDSEVWDMFRALYEEDEEDPKVIRDALGEYLADTNHFVQNEQDGSLYAYNPDSGVFEDDGANRLNELLREKLRHHMTRREKDEIEDAVKDYTFTEELNGPDGYIRVNNGALNIPMRELEDATDENGRPRFHFTSSIDVEYDPDAECPKWRQFLSDILKSDAHIDKIRQFVGYCLNHWSLPHHKAAFVVGAQASGKSTMLDTITEMFGENASTSLTPQEITGSRFKPHHLRDSYVNIRSDIDDSMIENVGMFKEVVAGDRIMAEKKGKPSFMFKPTAKHLFATNKLPSASVDDAAFYRRVMLVSAPEPIPKDERVSDYDEELIEELPGILNWALDGLDELTDAGQFTADLPPDATKTRWRAWANSPERFEHLATENDPDHHARYSEVKNAYQRFCEEKGLPQQSKTELRETLTRHRNVNMSSSSFDGTNARSVKGIRIKDEYKTEDE